jgi:hypothetical protein
MVLKTFNLDEKIYGEFSKHCKKNGISMSKRVENFIREEMGKMRNGIPEKPEILEIPEPKESPKIENGLHPLSKYC